MSTASLTADGWRRQWQPSQHRRHSTHDYRAPGTYLVTATTHDRSPVFGHVDGSLDGVQAARLVPTPLGERVLYEEVVKIGHVFPMVEVWTFCLMPDHFHILLRVNATLPQGKSLGQVVAAFKGGITRAWRETSGATGSLFSPGYNDRILMRPGQLDTWKRYLDDNPRRLLLRQRCPQYFSRALRLTVGGTRYSAYGNFLLLRYPEKRQVFCHRRARYGQLTAAERSAHRVTPRSDDSPTEVPYELTEAYARESTATLGDAATGTVVVTPGISPGERDIKNLCLSRSLPLIMLQREPIGPLWKPEASRFRACESGTLLILAPWPDDLEGESDYAQFHNLNALAATLCALPPDASCQTHCQ